MACHHRPRRRMTPSYAERVEASLRSAPLDDERLAKRRLRQRRVRRIPREAAQRAIARPAGSPRTAQRLTTRRRKLVSDTVWTNK